MKSKKKSYVVLQPSQRHRRKGKKGGGAGRVPGPKKAPQGSWPNGNEPQGLLCFTGRSSACENLWNKAALNYLSQCPDSTGPLLSVCYYRARRAPKLRFLWSSFRPMQEHGQPGHRLRWRPAGCIACHMVMEMRVGGNNLIYFRG